MLYTLVLQFYQKEKKNGQKKKTITFSGKNSEEKQNSTKIMISVDGKRTVFPVKLIL